MRNFVSVWFVVVCDGPDIYDVIMHNFNIAPPSTLFNSLYRHSGIVTRVYPYPGYFATLAEVTGVSGKGMGFLQNIQKFRVRVSELTEVPGMYGGRGVHNSQNFPVGMKMLYPYPGYCGTGVHNSQNFPVGMKMLYPYPGYCGTGVHNSQKFQVRV